MYAELKDQGLELLAVALDTAGVDAIRSKARPSDLSDRTELLRPLRAWGEREWAAQAIPTFPCLIDEAHLVADLYGMVNVPTAVWIDEAGRVVRPAEPAGVGDEWRAMDHTTFTMPTDLAERQISRREYYLNALRDWVHHGSESRFSLSADEVRARPRPPSDGEARAAAHARVAGYLFTSGHMEAARRHIETAVELAPRKWNYRRQSMVLQPDLIGELNNAPEFFQALDSLGDEPFYETIQMPGIAPPRDEAVTNPH